MCEVPRGCYREGRASPTGSKIFRVMLYLLLDLGYTQTEIEHILQELERKKVPFEQSRAIDEFTLNDNGF